MIQIGIRSTGDAFSPHFVEISEEDSNDDKLVERIELRHVFIYEENVSFAQHLLENSSSVAMKKL